MASISFDEEVFCNHLSKFYESWKAVSLLYMPHNIYEGLLQHFAAGIKRYTCCKYSARIGASCCVEFGLLR